MQKPHRNRCKNNRVTPLQSGYFYCFEKSNQEKIELGDNEASAEVTSRGQQEENFLTKLFKTNSILQPK